MRSVLSLFVSGLTASLISVLWASSLDVVAATVATVVLGPIALGQLVKAFVHLHRRLLTPPGGMSDADFDALIEEVESAGAQPDTRDPDRFAELVQQALDDLPQFMRDALDDNVAVVVSDSGAEHGALGLYHGDGIAFDTASDRIIIFRDTLIEHFGHDPGVLREQVRITVLHELAHHLGADEGQVRRLGL